MSSNATIEPLSALAAAARDAASNTGRQGLLALPGTVSGAALTAWRAQVAARYGEPAVKRLRAIDGFGPESLADAPTPTQRLPIGLPTALTAALVEHELGGDWLALEAPMAADAQARLPTATRLLLRALGPARVLARAGELHAALYDQGALRTTAAPTVAPGWNAVSAHAAGSALYAAPAWCLLQAFALRATVRVCLPAADVEVDCTARADADARFTVRWRP